MRAPTEHQRKGLEHIIPVLDAILTVPDSSELQELSGRELDQVEAAFDWIISVARNKSAPRTPHLSD